MNIRDEKDEIIDTQAKEIDRLKDELDRWENGHHLWLGDNFGDKPEELILFLKKRDDKLTALIRAMVDYLYHGPALDDETVAEIKKVLAGELA